MPPEAIFDVRQLDCSRVIADQEAIRRVNPQRFEMEQLHGIVYIDAGEQLVIGFRDVRDDEFWCRGHMPGYPLLPGVLICEAAAQICSYYVALYNPIPSDFLGFGGMENVRFRGVVRPGDRMLMIAKGIRLHPRKCSFNCQAFVGDTMVFHGEIIGVPMRAGEKPAEG